MFAVIYLPEFSLQAVLRQEESLDRPAVVIDDTAREGSVLQANEQARAAGLHEGMTSTQASARCTGVLIKRRSLEQEATAQATLLQCAGSFSPRLEATGPGLCTLDLQGLSLSQPESWCLKIIAQLAVLGLRAQVGVGDNPLLALYAAQAAEKYCLVEQPELFLRGLPLEVLPMESDVLRLLKRWGLSTFGQLWALGKNALAERLGPAGALLYEHSLARQTRPLKTLEIPETFSEATILEHEIETFEPLLFLLQRFLDQLCLRLELSHRVAESLTLRLELAGSAPYEKVFAIPAPTRHAKTLLRMLQTHFENFKSPHPVVGLGLSIEPGKERAQQFSLFESALKDPNQFDATLARLSGLLGKGRVGLPGLVCSHRPDPIQLQPVSIVEKRLLEGRKGKTRTEAKSQIVGLVLRRFRPPIRAQVQMQQEQPRTVWSSLGEAAIAEAHGPFRSSGDWWGTDPWQREEWDVRTERGELFRLFREAEAWFVEGCYD